MATLAPHFSLSPPKWRGVSWRVEPRAGAVVVFWLALLMSAPPLSVPLPGSIGVGPIVPGAWTALPDGRGRDRRLAADAAPALPVMTEVTEMMPLSAVAVMLPQAEPIPAPWPVAATAAVLSGPDDTAVQTLTPDTLVTGSIGGLRPSLPGVTTPVSAPAAVAPATSCARLTGADAAAPVWAPDPLSGGWICQTGRRAVGGAGGSLYAALRGPTRDGISAVRLRMNLERTADDAAIVAETARLLTAVTADLGIALDPGDVDALRTGKTIAARRGDWQLTLRPQAGDGDRVNILLRRAPAG